MFNNTKEGNVLEKSSQSTLHIFLTATGEIVYTFGAWINTSSILMYVAMKFCTK